MNAMVKHFQADLSVEAGMNNRSSNMNSDTKSG